MLSARGLSVKCKRFFDLKTDGTERGSTAQLPCDVLPPILASLIWNFPLMIPRFGDDASSMKTSKFTAQSVARPRGTR